MELAILKTGGKQYKVSPGSVITIEKMIGEYKAGDKITFSEIMLKEDAKGLSIGSPFVAGASVEGTLESIGRNKKVVVIRYKAKSKYFKKNGHKQPHFKVKIDAIK